MRLLCLLAVCTLLCSAPVGARQVVDEAGCDGGRSERAVVDGRDPQGAARQLPAPAAGRGAEVDGSEPRT